MKKTKSKKSLHFSKYQQLAKKSAQFKDPSKNLNMSLYALQTETATLRNFQTSDLLSSNHNARVSEKLGDILWHLSNVASVLGLPLQESAEFNLEKVLSNYVSEHAVTLKDEVPLESLPERMEVAFLPWEKDKVILAMQLENGGPIQIGDRIDDNSHEDDYYRFHDVLHLSFLAHLNWSPVFRALLRRKRKNSPTIDRVEDGARAAGIEEARNY